MLINIPTLPMSFRLRTERPFELLNKLSSSQRRRSVKIYSFSNTKWACDDVGVLYTHTHTCHFICQLVQKKKNGLLLLLRAELRPCMYVCSAAPTNHSSSLMSSGVKKKKKSTVSNHTILLLGTDNLCATSYTDDSGASAERTAAQARKFPKSRF